MLFRNLVEMFFREYVVHESQIVPLHSSADEDRLGSNVHRLCRGMRKEKWVEFDLMIEDWIARGNITKIFSKNSIVLNTGLKNTEIAVYI